MALNFPLNPNDGDLHIDPISGLKYIFNASIGGWETAIQPPAIVTDTNTPPDIALDGFLWYDSTTRLLYVKRGGTWIVVGGSQGGTGGASVAVGSSPPSPAVQGDLWWDDVSGNLFVYYTDADSNQWVVASPNVGGEANTNIFVGPSAPADPIVGTVWYNTIDNVLYIYTGGSPAWEAALAPVDGVSNVGGNDPIFITTDDDIGNPVVNIKTGTESTIGAVRFATHQEVLSVSPVNAAITPSALSYGIESYLPDASTTFKGVIRIATDAEAVAGKDTLTAITPHSLSLVAASSGNPTGTIIAFAGQNPPAGYLVCNGGLLNGPEKGYITKVANGRVIPDSESDPAQISLDLKDLYDVVGSSYSFNGTAHMLPELRGEFIRGANDGRIGVDQGRSLGSYQVQSVQSHYHQGAAGTAQSDVNGTQSIGGGNRIADATVYQTSASGAEGLDSEATFKAAVTETRPRNLALLYCIKY